MTKLNSQSLTFTTVMEQERRIKVHSGNAIKGWFEFINFNRCITSLKTKKVIFDFTDFHFATPSNLVSLACLIEEYFQNNTEIEFVCHGESAAIIYLERLRFFEYWQHGYDRTEYTENLQRDSLFLWKTSLEKIDPLATYVQSFYENNYFDGSDCTNLNNALTETVNNIFDHANCNGISYVFAQYVEADEIFKVSVCDFGIGIPAKVNEFLKGQGKRGLTHEKALAKAFEFKFTTQSTPRNRGFGLDNLKMCVTDGKGELYYYSSNAEYQIKSDGRTANALNENFFPGTLIDLRIDASDLPKKDFFGGDYNF